VCTHSTQTKSSQPSVTHTWRKTEERETFFSSFHYNNKHHPKEKKVYIPTHLSWERLYDVSLTPNEYSLYNSTPSVHAQNNKKSWNILFVLAVVISGCASTACCGTQERRRTFFLKLKKKGLLFFVWATTQLCGRESSGWWTNLLWVYIYTKYTWSKDYVFNGIWLTFTKYCWTNYGTKQVR